MINSPSPITAVPDELIAEVLSLLTVKSLLRLKCVSKLIHSSSKSTSINLHKTQTLHYFGRSIQVNPDLRNSLSYPHLKRTPPPPSLSMMMILSLNSSTTNIIRLLVPAMDYAASSKSIPALSIENSLSVSVTQPHGHCLIN